MIRQTRPIAPAAAPEARHDAGLHAVQHGGALHHRVLLRARAALHRRHEGHRRRREGPAQLHRLPAQVLHHVGAGSAGPPVCAVLAARLHPGLLAGQPRPPGSSRTQGPGARRGRRPHRRDGDGHVLGTVHAGPRAGHARRPGQGHPRVAQPRHAQLRAGAGRRAGARRAPPPSAAGPDPDARPRRQRRLHLHAAQRVRRHRPLDLPRVRRPGLARPRGPHGRHHRALPQPGAARVGCSARPVGPCQEHFQRRQETKRLNIMRDVCFLRNFSKKKKKKVDCTK